MGEKANAIEFCALVSGHPIARVGAEKMLAGTNGAEDLSVFDRLEADFKFQRISNTEEK